ncbi:reverse transcriptase family protein, partial [Solemya elarraichensis gill symbiont]|uniref:reverse transcriptase family protein n=1 Tax=Solemya elarraichensis gill symbiont TaxID=1918949 RepID=UPI0010839F74
TSKAHHPIIFQLSYHQHGSTHTQVYNFMDSSNYSLLNLPQPTFLSSSHGTFSHIDLSLAHPSLYMDFTWNVLPDLHGSDHFPIILQSSKYLPAPQPTRWKLHAANWAAFGKLCDNTSSCSNISEFSEEILNAALQTIPRTSGMPARKHRPWFDTACKAAIAKKKKALRKFKKSPTQSNLEEFRLFRAQARRQLRSSRKLSWRKYVSTLNIHSSPHAVWKTVRSMQGKCQSTIPNHLADGNNTVTSLPDMANHLAKQFAHNSSSENSSPSFTSYRNTQESIPIDFSSSNSESYNIPFSLIELQEAISSSHATCPGADEIHYSMINHLPPIAVSHLLSLLNDSWINNTLPPDWRHALVIPISKPGKDPTQANSYRPISLTSCLCKTFERMINNRLVWVLESQKLLSPLQCGFRKRHSTVDHLIRLDSFVKKAFRHSEHAVTVFFDLEKAYDTTWKYGILKDLHKLGFRGRLPLFILNFLQDRTFQVRIGSTLSDTFVQEMGVPQGCVLSVTLFSIKINSIVDTLSDNTVGSLFVDDFSTSCRSRDMSSI